jgi:hypothetical protein
MANLIRPFSEIGSILKEPQKKSDRLSIQLRVDGFSFSISNPADLSIYYLSQYNLKLEHNQKSNWETLSEGLREWLLETKIKTDLFEDVVVYLDTVAYSIVPAAFNLNEKDRDQLLFNQDVDYDFVLHRNNISGAKEDLVFALPVKINELMLQHFNGLKTSHTINQLHEILFKSKRNKKTAYMVYACVSNRDLHILVYENENPIFINSYGFTTKEDFIYFVLLVYEYKKLNTEETPLILLGDISYNSLLYGIAYQYIKNIDFIKHHPSIQFPDIQSNSSFVQKHYILLSSAL